jgi:hypothetical protein
MKAAIIAIGALVPFLARIPGVLRGAVVAAGIAALCGSSQKGWRQCVAQTAGGTRPEVVSSAVAPGPETEQGDAR